MHNLLALLMDVAATALFSAEDSPMKGWFHVRTGEPLTKLALILDQNAAGKSLARRTISVLCNVETPTIECINPSMERRTTSGIERAFMYANEKTHSTGAISATALTTAIRTSTNRRNPHLLFLDEPDTGMSDDLAAGSALDLLDYLAEPNPYLVGVIVVTHCKAMVRQLSPPEAAEMPHLAFLGASLPESLEAWWSAPVIPIRPETIRTDALARFREVAEFMQGSAT